MPPGGKDDGRKIRSVGKAYLSSLLFSFFLPMIQGSRSPTRSTSCRTAKRPRPPLESKLEDSKSSQDPKQASGGRYLLVQTVTSEWMDGWWLSETEQSAHPEIKKW